MTSEERVRKVWLDADKSRPTEKCPYWSIYPSADSKDEIGRGPSELLAWDDAASRLRAEPQQPSEQEIERIAHDALVLEVANLKNALNDCHAKQQEMPKALFEEWWKDNAPSEHYRDMKAMAKEAWNAAWAAKGGK